MPKIAYETPRWLEANIRRNNGTFNAKDLSPKQSEKMWTIVQALKILEEYEAKGFQLTLRQLYYQFVARDLIANSDKEYKRLGGIVSEGRMGGLIDWDHLVDRGRNFLQRPHWSSPASIVKACAEQYSEDRWDLSDYRIEVWVEKQALEDIIARACRPYDVGYIACKGYMSQSEMWSAAQRLAEYEVRGQKTVILHLGDHDPSGIDMTRDIQDRLRTFRSNAQVQRIALNMDQIDQYGPPPNPAKVTDSRAADYIEKFGHESWELDALEPEVITDLIQTEIKEHIDSNYESAIVHEKKGRETLKAVSDNWHEVVDTLPEDD
jgi:hypothetical protein